MADEVIHENRSASTDLIGHKERIEAIRYDEFFSQFMLSNKMCVFSNEMTRSWRSRKEWVRNGKPNFEFLSDRFGEAMVPVADCGKEQFGSHKKQNMKFQQFLDYWQNRVSSSDPRCLYLKDWHFCNEFPEYEAYEVPPYFTSDWLNEFWDQQTDDLDDYRFVYMGPEGSWTPFHADVFRSYSWSANICGCKKWIIYPPGEERYLRDKFGNLPYDIMSDELHDIDKFPQYPNASDPIVVIQQEGEVIFVPRILFIVDAFNLCLMNPQHPDHQKMQTMVLVNTCHDKLLEDTISINHNWTNACGLERMSQHLQCELNLVEESIMDCRDMEGWYKQCQRILKASSGIDFVMFLRFIETIAERRIGLLKLECCKYDQRNSGPRNSQNNSRKSDDHSEVECASAGQTQNPDCQCQVITGDILRIQNPAAKGSPLISNLPSSSSHVVPRMSFEKDTRNLGNCQSARRDVFRDWICTVRSVAPREKYNELDYCRFDLQRIVNCVAELQKDVRLAKLEHRTHVSRVTDLLERSSFALHRAKECWGTSDLQDM